MATALYSDLKYETFSECEKTCTKMKVATHYKFKLHHQNEEQSAVTRALQAQGLLVGSRIFHGTKTLVGLRRPAWGY